MSALNNTRPIAFGVAASQAWPAPEFIIGSLQPGDLGIISGSDGVGKSWLTLAMAATVSFGKSVCGIFPPPAHRGPVLIIAGEDRVADHGRRMAALAEHMKRDGMKIEADDDNFVLIPLQGKRVPLLKKEGDHIVRTEHAQALEELVKGYRLVFIDPLRMFHDLPESDGIAMDTLARYLVTIAMANQQAFIGVQHASQHAILSGRDDHHAGRGATDLPAACRGVWTIRRMTKPEEADFDLSDGECLEWRSLANGKASHTREADRTWLRRGEFGVLYRPSYSPEEMSDAYASKKSRRRNGAV